MRRRLASNAGFTTVWAVHAWPCSTSTTVWRWSSFAHENVRTVGTALPRVGTVPPKKPSIQSPGGLYFPAVHMLPHSAREVHTWPCSTNRTCIVTQYKQRHCTLPCSASSVHCHAVQAVHVHTCTHTRTHTVAHMHTPTDRQRYVHVCVHMVLVVMRPQSALLSYPLLTLMNVSVPQTSWFKHRP